MEKRSSKDWQQEIPAEHKLVIMDSGGWDGKNFDYSFDKEKITFKEFRERLSKSSIMCKGDINNSLLKLERKFGVENSRTVNKDSSRGMSM